MRIGVFSVLFGSKPFEDTLDYLVELGLEAVEIGTGAYPGSAHCDPAALLASGGAGSDAAGAKVALVDLDLQFGQAATHLNLSPKLDFARLAGDDLARTDPEALAGYLTPHGSGLQLLAAPTSPDSAARISVEEVDQVISTLRTTFDFVVVDCGSRLDPRSIWVMEQAQEIVFVVFPELGSLRAMSDLLQFLADAKFPVSHNDVADHLVPDGFDKSTIYRCLIELADANLVARLDLGDHIWRFEMLAEGEDHPHFMCLDCGKVSCLPDVKVRITPTTAGARGADITEILLKGHCAECQ